MCRQQNIPCLWLDGENHAWNAVYLRGRWNEVDVTWDIQRKSHVPDGSDVDRTHSSKNDYCYKYYPDYKREKKLEEVDVFSYHD